MRSQYSVNTLNALIMYFPVTETDIDLSEVVETMEPVASVWKRVGVHLRLPISKLDQIEGDLKDCLMEMLKQWLNRNYDTVKNGEPSWRMLAQAVARENGAVFKTIAEQHKGIILYFYCRVFGQKLKNCMYGICDKCHILQCGASNSTACIRFLPLLSCTIHYLLVSLSYSCEAP